MKKLTSILTVKISKRTFWTSFTIFVILIAAVFGYFYWKKTSVLDVVNDIPIVEYTKPPKYAHDIFGQQNLPFKLPLGVLAYNGEVFVSDSDLGVIQVFDYNGKHLRTFGNTGGQGKLKHPYGMAFNKDTLYVADGGLGQLMMYDRFGEFRGSLRPKEDGVMANPAGLLIKDDKIYFTDLSLHTINIMDKEGNVLVSFGGRGEDPGEVLYPHSIAVNDKNEIFVSDSGNNRVLIFSNKGRYLRVLGDEKVSISTPRGIGFDNKGNLYVVSGMENRVHVFDDKEKWIFEFNEVVNKDSLSLPNGLSLDGNGQVFVSETGSYKVAIFSYNTIQF